MCKLQKASIDWRSLLPGPRPAEFLRGWLIRLFISLALGVGALYAGASARAASSSEPKGLETMRVVALELLRAQDYDRSIAVYREIARLTPQDPRSHYDLAATLSFIRRYEDAVPPIQAAIRLNPDDLRAQEMASLIYLNLRWYRQAFDATLKAAELGEPTAMYSLVNMYEKGLGVDADVDRAVFWAIKAAEGGQLGAMALMEKAHRSGRLRRRLDEVQANAWARRLREAKSTWK